MRKKLLQLFLSGLILIFFSLVKLSVPNAEAQTCYWSGSCGGNLRCCVTNPPSSATMGTQSGQCMVSCPSYRAECAYQGQTPDSSQQIVCCGGLAEQPCNGITTCQGPDFVCQPRPTYPPLPTQPPDPCAVETGKPNSCSCTDTSLTSLQCASGYCGESTGSQGLTCQDPPAATAPPTPTATATPIPTATPILLACDPDKSVDSINKIDNLDFDWWLAEFTGTKPTTQDSDCDKNKVIDIFDFNKMRDMRWFSNVSAPIQTPTTNPTACTTSPCGPKNPSSVMEGSSNYNPWSNLKNISLNDDAYATVTFSTYLGGYFSNQIIAKGFGFDIPAGAVINGIKIEVERKANVRLGISDQSIYLTKDGSGVASHAPNNIRDSVWPTVDSYETYGGPTDLWKTPVSGVTWTPADINSPNFGFFYSVASTNPGNIASIDHIRATVYFTQ